MNQVTINKYFHAHQIYSHIKYIEHLVSNPVLSLFAIVLAISSMGLFIVSYILITYILTKLENNIEQQSIYLTA